MLTQKSVNHVNPLFNLWPMFFDTGVRKIVFGLKPGNFSVIRPINGTAMNKNS